MRVGVMSWSTSTQRSPPPRSGRLATLSARNGDGPSPDHSVHLPSDPDATAVEALLRSRQPELVTYSGWEAIDNHERALGEPSGRPRVKLTSIEELLRIAAAEEP